MEQFYFQSNSAIQDQIGDPAGARSTSAISSALSSGNYPNNYDTAYGAYHNSANTASSTAMTNHDYDFPHYDTSFKDNINLHLKLGPSAIKEHQEQLQLQYNQLYPQNTHLTQKRLAVSPVVVTNPGSLPNDYTFHQSPNYGRIQATPPTLPLTQLMAAYNDKPFNFEAPQQIYDLEHNLLNAPNGVHNNIQHNMQNSTQISLDSTQNSLDSIQNSLHSIQNGLHNIPQNHDITDALQANINQLPGNNISSDMHPHEHHHHHHHNQLQAPYNHEIHDGFFNHIYALPQIDEEKRGQHGMHPRSHTVGTGNSSNSRTSNSRANSHFTSQGSSLSGSISDLSQHNHHLIPLKQRLYDAFSPEEVKAIRFMEAESTCSHCDLLFTNYIDLVDHYDSNAAVLLNTRTHVCPVKLCPMLIIGFSKRANLRHHVVTHHFSKGYILPEDAIYSDELQQLIYTCDDSQCGKGFYRRDSLTRHIKLVHDNQLSQFNMKLRRGSEESLRRKRKRNRH